MALPRKRLADIKAIPAKFAPPKGSLPVLQFVPVGDLQIDAHYQRSIDNAGSQRLIRRIAEGWNWDLCQVLVVSRRGPGQLFVIDGQHRWQAAQQRGDIAYLPCVVLEYKDAGEEAERFVQLNERRRHLTRLEVFKAELASGDADALAIVAALEGAGMRLAPHENHNVWKPGMIANVGGLKAAWRKSHGAMRDALAVLARAWPDTVLRYAGSIFPGVFAICHRYPKAEAEQVAFVLRSRGQADWRKAPMMRRAIDPNLNLTHASGAVMLEAWRAFICEDEAATVKNAAAGPRAVNGGTQEPAAVPLPYFKPDHAGLSWCDQCEMRVNRKQAEGCKSRFCSFKKAQAASSAPEGQIGVNAA